MHLARLRLLPACFLVIALSVPLVTYGEFDESAGDCRGENFDTALAWPQANQQTKKIGLIGKPCDDVTNTCTTRGECSAERKCLGKTVQCGNDAPKPVKDAAQFSKETAVGSSGGTPPSGGTSVSAPPATETGGTPNPIQDSATGERTSTQSLLERYGNAPNTVGGQAQTAEQFNLNDAFQSMNANQSATPIHYDGSGNISQETYDRLNSADSDISSLQPREYSDSQQLSPIEAARQYTAFGQQTFGEGSATEQQGLWERVNDSVSAVLEKAQDAWSDWWNPESSEVTDGSEWDSAIANQDSDVSDGTEWKQAIEGKEADDAQKAALDALSPTKEELAEIDKIGNEQSEIREMVKRSDALNKLVDDEVRRRQGMSAGGSGSESEKKLTLYYPGGCTVGKDPGCSPGIEGPKMGSKNNYIDRNTPVIAAGPQSGLKFGDQVKITNPTTGLTTYALVGDVCPKCGRGFDATPAVQSALGPYEETNRVAMQVETVSRGNAWDSGIFEVASLNAGSERGVIVATVNTPTLVASIEYSETRSYSEAYSGGGSTNSLTGGGFSSFGGVLVDSLVEPSLYLYAQQNSREGFSDWTSASSVGNSPTLTLDDSHLFNTIDDFSPYTPFDSSSNLDASPAIDWARDSEGLSEQIAAYNQEQLRAADAASDAVDAWQRENPLATLPSDTIPAGLEELRSAQNQTSGPANYDDGESYSEEGPNDIPVDSGSREQAIPNIVGSEPVSLELSQVEKAKEEPLVQNGAQEPKDATYELPDIQDYENIASKQREDEEAARAREMYEKAGTPETANERLERTKQAWDAARARESDAVDAVETALLDNTVEGVEKARDAAFEATKQTELAFQEYVRAQSGENDVAVSAQEDAKEDSKPTDSRSLVEETWDDLKTYAEDVSKKAQETYDRVISELKAWAPGWFSDGEPAPMADTEDRGFELNTETVEDESRIVPPTAQAQLPIDTTLSDEDLRTEQTKTPETESTKTGEEKNTTASPAPKNEGTKAPPAKATTERAPAAAKTETRGPAAPPAKQPGPPNANTRHAATRESPRQSPQQSGTNSGGFMQGIMKALSGIGTQLLGMLRPSPNNSSSGAGNSTAPASTNQTASSTLPRPPAVTLIASPLVIQGGGPVLLSWSSVNTKTCEVLTDTKEKIGEGTDGKKRIEFLDATSTFSISCTGLDGSTVPPGSVTIVVE